MRSTVCDCHNFTLKLEESVKTNLEEEDGEEADEAPEAAVLVDLHTLWPSGQEDQDTHPSASEGTEEEPMDVVGRHSIGSALSTGCKADYTVYTLGQKGQSKVVAIIDAKRYLKPHVTAQVIGYYSAFEVGHPGPIVLILTASELKVVLFPFQDGHQQLVNAVALQPLKLWKVEGRTLDLCVMKLLLSLMDERSAVRQWNLKADKAQLPQGARIPKNRVSHVVTDQEKYEEMKRHMSAMRRTNKQLKKELQDKETQRKKELKDKEKDLEEKDRQLEEMSRQLDALQNPKRRK